MAKKKGSKPNVEREMSLLGHLDELRMRLIISVGTLVLATLVSYFFARPVLELLIKPVSNLTRGKLVTPETERAEVVVVNRADGSFRFAHPELLGGVQKLDRLTFMVPLSDDATSTKALTIVGSPLQAKIFYSRPFDAVLMPLKVAIVMGVFISLFVWIYQIWLFVAPGLTDKEKRLVRPLLMGVVILFPIGALVAYGFFFIVLRIMQTYALSDVDTFFPIQEYLKVMTGMMIVFGFIFELPLVVAMLARVGIVTPELLRHYRRHIYVLLAFLAMVFTPADPYSMLIALLPLIGLFEISVFVSKPMARLRQKAEAEEEAKENAAS